MSDHAGAVTLSLELGPHGADALWVARVEGRERLSQPYEFAVDLWPLDGAPLELDPLLGAEAALTMRRPTGEERIVHGEAHAVALASVAAGLLRYRVTIAPRLARLALGRRSRVFQDLSVPEIVGQVLEERGVAHRLDLAGRYPARELVLQHAEADLAFLSRLLEAEGIWYRFEHSAGSHELVLADAPSAAVKAPDPVAYRPHGERGGGTGHVRQLQRAARVVPAVASARDFDDLRPSLDLAARTRGGDAPEVYDWPGGYTAPPDGARRVRTRLEELQHGAETFDGHGTSLVPAPGVAFEIEDGPRLLAVGVVHRGEQERSATGAGKTSYESRFEAIGADRPYRPRRRTPWPRLSGIETATVVGPAGEEIHVDDRHRVKVQFHWDREGKRDDRACAWLRLAQPWAGAGMGASFVPRLGQEVVIRWLDGDPDRPVVVGAVYNGHNPPPVELPHQRTQTAQRTSSSPHDGGYNELRLEDDAGREEVHLHAQRDREVAVENDETREVRANASLAVDKDRTKQVLGSQQLDVGRDDARGVGGSEATTVALARTVSVGGAHEERVGAAQLVTVGGAQEVTVSSASVVSVGAAAALSVGAAYAVNVGGAVNALVGGLKSTEVGGEAVEIVGVDREERIARDREGVTRSDATIEVLGAVRQVTEHDVTDTVDGTATIVVTEGAAAEPIDATFTGTSSLKLAVGGNVVLAMTSGGEVLVAGSAVTVEGTSEIAMKGNPVKKIQPGGPQAQQVQPPRIPPGEYAWIDVTLADKDGRPVPNEPFRVEFADGTVKEGRLDRQGKARVYGPKEGSCKVTFPRLEGKAWRPA